MSVKKMDEVPEKKTESKILAKMGKKEQGRCQKESVVLKNGQSTDNGKHVTVRGRGSCVWTDSDGAFGGRSQGENRGLSSSVWN